MFFRATLLLVLFFALACQNLPPDSAAGLKVYPNPYNPENGVLTIERTDGGSFSTMQNELIVYDYSLREVYRTNLLPVAGSADKKLIWSGLDSAGIRVSPGLYYLKVIANTAAGPSHTESMIRLIVQ